MLDSTDLGFWEKIKYLFTNPNLFFNSIKDERGIRNSFIMYLVFGIGISIFF
jgi:hypothetical protein